MTSRPFLSPERSASRYVFALFLAVLPTVFCVRANDPTFTDHMVEVDNVNLHYIESGQGQPVILIHGNAGDAGDFKLGAIDLLATMYHVIAIDRAGHGQS